MSDGMRGKRRFWKPGDVVTVSSDNKAHPKPMEVETPCCGETVVIFRYGKGGTTKHTVKCCRIRWRVTIRPGMEPKWEGADPFNIAASSRFGSRG